MNDVDKMSKPKSKMTAEEAMSSPKTIVLKRSKITVTFDEDFSTADVMAAQKASGKDASLFSLYLAQRIATFDGAPLTMGEIRDKVKGKDYLQLTGAILGDSDEEEAGNA